MVPANKILETAEKEQVDIIGLSGLITPSLDEMVFVAEEMEKRGMKTPLLIGGATTSKVHTAVKIAPKFTGPLVHVLDASKSVSVAGSLLSKDRKAAYVAGVNQEFEEMRVRHANKKSRKDLLTIVAARENKTKIDWAAYIAKAPKNLGVTVYDDFDLCELREFIDWSPFFWSWQLKGKYPEIFEDGKKGEEAKKLFDDANAMLDKIIDEKWLKARGVVGLFAANSIDSDDIEIYQGNDRSTPTAIAHMLRQQNQKGTGIPNLCLSDYVAPKSSGVEDYMGCFAVTAGIGIEEHVKNFEDKQDDYSSILLKALADRLAEAFAEKMHKLVRKDLWGYAGDESLSNDDLIKENYQGIRPAPGYPACPEHTEKDTIFELLDAEKNAGMKLTSSKAMYPAASVSGWYFGHPESKYFGLGKIAQDQLADYCVRKGWDESTGKKWLAPSMDL